MKRLTILACAALILLAAAGCGNTDSTDDSTDSSAESIIIQEDSSRDIPVPAPDSIIGPISISESEQPHEHIWEPASCETPKTCSVCGTTEGKPAGHKWIAATCTEKRICEVCSKQAGEPLGHDWSRATLSSPKTCKRCGITEGQPLNYTYYVDGFVNTKTDPLSIRTVPDGNGEVIAEIPRDSLIRIYKCGLEDWFYTTYNGSEGYIRSMYVTLRDSFYTSRQYYGRMRVNTLSDPLGIRPQPKTEGPIIAEIPRNEIIDVYTCGDPDWYYTLYKGRYGYVRAMYLADPTDDSSEPSGSDEPDGPGGSGGNSSLPSDDSQNSGGSDTSKKRQEIINRYQALIEASEDLINDYRSEMFGLNTTYYSDTISQLQYKISLYERDSTKQVEVKRLREELSQYQALQNEYYSYRFYAQYIEDEQHHIEELKAERDAELAAL